MAVRRTLSAVTALLLGTAGALVAVAGPAAAADRAVPGTYATIQAAIDASSPGDRILVAPGTYTENLNVNVANIQLIGDGVDDTNIVGAMTITQPVTVSQFNIVADLTAPYDAATPITITGDGGGTSIFNNFIAQGYQLVYISGATGDPAGPTVIESNTFYNVGAANTGQVWVASTDHVVIQNNSFANPSPTSPADSVGVNLVCGSSHIVIDQNLFENLGNAIVSIANDSCDPSTDVEITGNDIDTTGGSALYFGTNNLQDYTITGNTIQNVPAGASAIRFDNGWLGTDPGVPIDGFLIQGNTFGPAGYGIRVNTDIVLADDLSIHSVGNTFTGIVVNSIVGGQDGPCVTTTDDVFNGSTFIENVCVANTPPAPVLPATGPTSPLLPLTAGALFLLAGLALLVARRRAA